MVPVKPVRAFDEWLRTPLTACPTRDSHRILIRARDVAPTPSEKHACANSKAHDKDVAFQLSYTEGNADQFVTPAKPGPRRLIFLYQ